MVDTDAVPVRLRAGPGSADPVPARGGEQSRRAERWYEMRLRPAATALLLYTGMAALLLADVWRRPGARLPGEAGDPLMFTWFLAWTPWALEHSQNPLLTDYLHVPNGVNLMWNTAMPLAGVVLWPVTAVVGPQVSYGLLITACFALSAWCAFLAFRRFVASQPAAFLGGLVYGFSPYQLAHGLGHANLALTVAPPLVLLAMHELLGRDRRRPWQVGAALGLLVAAQGLLGEEVLLTTALTTAVGLVWLALLHRRKARRCMGRVAAAVPACVAVAGAILAVPLAFQFRGPYRISEPLRDPATLYGLDVAEILLPTRLQALAPSTATEAVARYQPNILETGGFLAPLLVVAAVSVVMNRRQPWVVPAALTGLTMLILALGPRLVWRGTVTSVPLPWRLTHDIPLLHLLLPARLVLYATLIGALLLALLLAHVQRTLSAASAATPSSEGRTRAAAAVGAGGLVVTSLLAFLPAWPYSSQDAASPPFFASKAVEQIPQGCPAVIAPFPAHTFQAAAMLWHVESDFRFRMVGGYALGPLKPGMVDYFSPQPSATAGLLLGAQYAPSPEPVPDELAQAVREDLQRWNACAVVVGPMPNRDAAERAVTQVLGGRAPQSVGGVSLWLLSDAVRRYSTDP